MLLGSRIVALMNLYALLERQIACVFGIRKISKNIGAVANIPIGPRSSMYILNIGSN